MAKKHLPVADDIVKLELETTSMKDLAKKYGYNKDGFRVMLKSRGITSPRSSGQRVFIEGSQFCHCGNTRMKGRNICNTCRNKIKREQYHFNKIKKVMLNGK